MKRDVVLGLILGCLVTSCAGVTFAWKYYGLQIASYDGKLLDVKPEDDKDFATCQNNNCVVMYSADFFALKTDYLDAKEKLIACQKTISRN